MGNLGTGYHSKLDYLTAAFDTEYLIDDTTKNQVAMNSVNTDFDVKHLISHKFNNTKIQADMKHFPFKIIDKDSKPIILNSKMRPNNSH
ncbi:heat shock protein 70 [Coccidioides immitis H538.4]|nr:heat shock protein 70 [Coccidioides immitis H538.4]